MPPRTALRITPDDNVFVALHDIGPSTEVEAGLLAAEAIPAKHKLAAAEIAPGEDVVMYGVVVGTATTPIARGALLHTDNVAQKASRYSGKAGEVAWPAPDVSAWAGRTFDGYHRDDGRVGTANHWIVVPLVFCESRNLAVLRSALTRALGFSETDHYEAHAAALAETYRAGGDAAELRSLQLGEASGGERLFPGIDGIKFLDHRLGCGGTPDDARALCGLVAGYIDHPNVAGATVLSLGCQNAQVELLEEELARRAPSFDKPLLVFEQQKYPSERDMLQRATTETFIGMAAADGARRSPAPLSKLCAGVECGGSDGFSGISANPTIGRTSDLLVALGGSVILSEFPELCGVEQDLCDRCTSPEIAARFAAIMEEYNARAASHGSGFKDNPSPGNIGDGLITASIKSAGAATKGGTSPVVDVLDYPEAVSEAGLSLLCTPGGDVESTTAMVGAGANLLLFSTGLGTPTGNPVAPTIKISTNTELAERLPDMIDFDAGPVVRGEADATSLGESLLELVIETASGRFVPNAVRLGQDDFLPWKRGVSL